MKQKLKGTITECYDCHYHALTWHQDINNLQRCLKCGGKLEILARQK